MNAIYQLICQNIVCNLFIQHKGGEKIKKQTITYNYLIPLLLITLTILFCASTVSANEIYVNTTGDDTTGNGSAENPYLTIQQGITNLEPNGTIRIANGMYRGKNNTNLTINKNMSIIGESQFGTIIYGEGINWIFQVNNSFTATIMNLTLHHGVRIGNDEINCGGAILNYGNLTVENCTFTCNFADSGGAITNYCKQGEMTVTIQDCTFTDNHAISTANPNTLMDINGKGGAICNFAEAYTSILTTVNHCTFTKNAATKLGGAICNMYSVITPIANCIMENSTFIDNNISGIDKFGAGGAIASIYGNNTVHFNRFYNNTAYMGDALLQVAGSMNATLNWWGSNTDPSTIPNLFYCGAGGIITYDPWIVLTISADPTTIYNTKQSTITVNLLYDSRSLTDPNNPAYYHTPELGYIPDTPVTFDADSLGDFAVSKPYTTVIHGGQNSTIIFNAVSPGASQVNATADNQTSKTTITIIPQKEDIYVATAADGGDDSNNGDYDSPFLTLQKALDAVIANGRIHIANGEYTETSNRGLNIFNNVTILRDTWIPGVGDSVIINAENKDCIIHNGYTLILQNLILVNGNNSGDWGYGGAILNGKNLIVENCTFTGNTANYGGAIANVLWGSVWSNYNGTYSNSWELSTEITSTITGCTFTSNIATYDGGAISNYIHLSSNVTAYNGANITATLKASILSNITNCIFKYNTAFNGGAISNNCSALAIATSEKSNATAVSDGSINSSISGCNLVSNCATYGGAISNYSITNLTATSKDGNATVVGNSSINDTITGCTLANNTATYGGALSVILDPTDSSRMNDGFTSIICNTELNSKLHFNRIVGNIATTGSAIYGSVYPSVNATYNWWGSNVNPSSQISGNVDYTPWLFMTINATPDTINKTQTSLITVSFNNYSSDGSSSYPLDPNLGHIPDGAPVNFSLVGAVLGSLNEPVPVTTTIGTASILFTASHAGIQQINATTDNQNVSAYVTIIPVSFVDITKEFRDLPWGSVITTAYYNDKIYAIVKVHNLGPDSTASVNVLDLLDGLTWTGNYYVLRTVGSYPSNNKTWEPNDSKYPFNGTNWNVGSLLTMIGSERWLAIEVTVNRTGTVSNYAETVNQSSYPYKGYANYTAYLTAVVAPTSLTVNSPSAYNGDTVNITATLTDTTHDTPITNKPVTITINNKTYTTNTDSNGQITWNYFLQNMNAQKYTINATFTGDNQYNASNTNGTLTVNLILTSLTVDDVSGNKDKTVPLTAILTDTHGTPLAGKIVEFWIDGAKVGEKTTDSTGTAIFNYTITEKPGNHILTAIFNETTMYQGCNATSKLYVPTANLYIQITSDKDNPTVGETFTLTYKLGNYGPDTADNVTTIIPVPKGFHILQIYGDGNWTINANGTITWTFNNVTVGDPYLHLYGYTSGGGDLLFTASIFSETYNLNTIGVKSLTIHAIPSETAKVNAATNENTVGMQPTGTPVLPLALAVLSVLGGLTVNRKTNKKD